MTACDQILNEYLIKISYILFFPCHIFPASKNLEHYIKFTRINFSLISNTSGKNKRLFKPVKEMRKKAHLNFNDKFRRWNNLYKVTF